LKLSLKLSNISLLLKTKLFASFKKLFCKCSGKF
jgi:hypothetical protein